MRRPTPALVISLLALFLALGGGAFAAIRSTGSAVNVVDPANATRIAHVSSGGSLQISGSVTATQTSATNFLHFTTFALTSSRGCVTIATPPSGKAMIVKEIVVDTFSDPTPGPDQNVEVELGPCGSGTGFVADVNPGSVGDTVVPIDPGIAVPAGSALTAFVDGQVEAESYVTGYSVSASSVPPVAGPASGAPVQR